MITSEAARRYARALAATAEQGGATDRVGDELLALAEAVSGHPDLRRLLMNPRIPRSRRIQTIERILEASGASLLVRQFARLVLEKDRLADLPAMAVCYRELADEKAGRARAQVRTAHPLDEAATGQIKVKLSAMTGKQVILEIEHDPALIGGLACRVGGVVMDGSIRNQLKNLREALTVR
ncbi:MAG: ATP synthase F1 subunit delta [Nitrospinota bacterium]